MLSQRLARTLLTASALIVAPYGSAVGETGQHGAIAVQLQSADEIVVTGSHILRSDLVATSPVSVFDGRDFAQHNAITVEQLLATAPQFAAGGNAFSNAPGDGAATLDLRGLGSKRTLVLIDGRRAPQYDTMGDV